MILIIGVFYYPVLLCPLLPQTTTINLVEIKSSSIDLDNRTITYISEDDFKKYPELGKLFCDVTPIGDENFGDRTTKFAGSDITVSERKASEMRKEHSSKMFYWKGGYYGILIQQP